MIAPLTRPTAADKQALIDLAKRLAENCPDMRQQASDIANRLLFKHTGHYGEPDNIWFHRWDSANSSPRSFTGWEHWGKPKQSVTFPQLVINRFYASDQDNADNLQQMAGFYTAGPDARVYNETNEVRLIPSDILNDFWGIDFANEYRTKLDNFWNHHAEDFRVMAKANYLAKALEDRDAGRLSDKHLRLLIKAVAGDIDWPVSLQALKAKHTPTAELQVHAFDICGHQASDILRIKDDAGRQYLYLPGETDAFHVFETDQDLYWWVLSQTNMAANRARFLTHFPLAENLEDDGGQLNHVLDQLFYGWGATHGPALVQNHQALTQDAFQHLADKTRQRMYADMNLSMHTNGDLRKQMWIGYLHAVTKTFGGLAAADWPVALALVGAGLADMGLNIDQAVNGHTTAERKAGVVGAILGAVDVLFNSLMLWPVGEEVTESLPVASANVTLDEITPLLPRRLVPADAEEALAGMETNEILQGTPPPVDGKMRGVFVNDQGETLISMDDFAYRVRWMQDLQGWAIVDPSNPFSFYGSVPVRLNESGTWVVLAGPGLKGGGGLFGKKPWGRARVAPATPLTPSFRYDIPAQLHDALRNAANGLEGKLISGERAVLSEPGHMDPYISFRALRTQMHSDAQAFLADYALPARPTLPALEAASSEPAIIKGVLKHADGLVIGESHASVASKKFLIDNMALLAKKKVRTLFMEHLLTDYHQVDLDTFARTGVMPEPLETYLKTMDRSFGTDPQGRYTFLELVRSANEHHIRVQAIDCAVSYRLNGMTDPEDKVRQELMNYFAHTVIGHDQATRGVGKWMALMGNTHAGTYNGVPGVAELEGAIGIRVEDVAPYGSHGVRIDSGETLPSGAMRGGAGFVKSDFYYPMPTLRATRDFNELLPRPGMFTIEGRVHPRIVHRSGDGTLVNTPILSEGAMVYIDRPRWTYVHQRRFNGLKELISGLALCGLKHVD